MKNTSKSHVAFKVRVYVLVKFEYEIKLFIIPCTSFGWNVLLNLKRVFNGSVCVVCCGKIMYLLVIVIDFYDGFTFVGSVSNYGAKKLLHAASWWDSCSWGKFDCNRWFFNMQNAFRFTLLVFLFCLVLMFLSKFGAHSVFKFVEQPENNEKLSDQKHRVKFKIMSLKVKEGVDYVPELVCLVPSDVILNLLLMRDH